VANIDMGTLKPQGYNLEKTPWQGAVSFEIKGTGKRVAYKNGFPDFSPYKHKPGPGSAGRSEVSIVPGNTPKSDQTAAWAASGFSAAERDALLRTHTWHHTTDIASGKVKLILVPKSINNSYGGYAHTGGRAIIEWMRDPAINIPF